MKVRFSALALRPGGGGVSTYAREFVNQAALQLPHAELSALVQRDAAALLPERVQPVLRPVVAGAVRAAFAAAPLRKVDVIHSLDVDLPFSTSARRVATVHDLSVFDTPWAFGRYRVAGERILLRRSLRAADAVLAVSQFTAERLSSLLGVESSVVPLGPASWARPPSSDAVTQVRKRYSLPPLFLLQVGTVEPRKNVALVADVATELSIPLVLAGSGSDGPRAPSGSVGLGYVDVADLPALYAAATVVTYASHYEGFGLPPIEAMACGAAVVASRCGALPEVVGNGAVLVAAHRTDDWVRAVRPLLEDRTERGGLQQRGISAAGRLSWSETVRSSITAYA